jgi:hypothetical protein
VVSVKAKKACDNQQDFAVNWATEGFAGIAKKRVLLVQLRKCDTE